MASVLLLALGPHLARQVRAVLVGLDEVEAAPRGAGVHDPHRGVLDGAELDPQLTVVVRVVCKLPRHLDPLDREADRVEHDGGRRGAHAAHLEGRRRGDPLLLEGDVEGEVLDQERPVALEVSRARREGERSPRRPDRVGLVGLARRVAAAACVKAVLDRHGFLGMM
jgi:hypothetical protein